MNKSAVLSFVIGIFVFIISIILPYLNGRDFLWFTIDGPSHFGTSGALYLINPIAMPAILLLWYAAYIGFQYGYRAKKIEESTKWYYKASIIVGIINFIILGWLTLILPVISWLIMGSPRNLM